MTEQSPARPREVKAESFVPPRMGTAIRNFWLDLVKAKIQVVHGNLAEPLVPEHVGD